MEVSRYLILHYVEEEEDRKDVVYKEIIRNFYNNSIFGVYKRSDLSFA